MSDDYSSTRFFKVVSHENNGDPTVQYAAWGNRTAALFFLGDLASNGYIDSDPNAQPDTTTPRTATVLYFFKDIKHQEDLQNHLTRILNFDFMDELNSRPPIGDVDVSRVLGDQLLVAALMA